MLAMKVDFQKENRTAAKWLLEYPERRQAYIEKSNIQYIGAAVNDGMPRGYDTGRPCESKGIRLADLEIERQWIITIENVEKTLGPKKLAFLDIRRQAGKNRSKTKGRPGWTDYTMVRYADWHNRNYGGDYVPGYQTLKEWWKELIDITVRIAIRRGCL